MVSQMVDCRQAHGLSQTGMAVSFGSIVNVTILQCHSVPSSGSQQRMMCPSNDLFPV